MNKQDLTGQTLGQYELRELIGTGGMGTVYRAYQASLRRVVAIKVLSTELSDQPGYIERFTREATTVASLEHAHIVPVYDYGTQRKISYVVMRLLTGGSLSARLARRAGEKNALPSLGETASLLNQLASALDYAHGEGIVHRDIKPGNVMFDNQGNAYLMDFGIAKLLEATSHLTGTGMTLGTPAYMAPEQWRAEEVFPATDQYALGVMIYQLVTGRLPFEAQTPYALMHKHLNELPTPPSAWRSGVPDAVAAVLERAMAKKPEQRFPSITAFAQAFDGAIQGVEGTTTNLFSFPMSRKPETPPPNPPPETVVEGGSMPVPVARSRPFYRKPLVWVAALVVLLLAAGGVYALSHKQIAGPSVSAGLPTLSATPMPATPTLATLRPTEPPAASTVTPIPPTLDILATANTLLTATQRTRIETATENALATLIQDSRNKTATATLWTATPTMRPTLTPTPTVTTSAAGTGQGIPAKSFGYLTLRGEPRDNANALGTLSNGSAFVVMGRTPDSQWLFVQSAFTTGWVIAAGVQFTDSTIKIDQIPVISLPTPTPTVTTSAAGTGQGIPAKSFGYLTLRGEPRDNANALGTLSNGSAFVVMGRTPDSQWLFVQSAFTTGWVIAAGVQFTDSAISIDQIPVISSSSATPTASTMGLGVTRTDSKGATQIFVLAGCFQMGSDPAKDPDTQANEQPSHEVCTTYNYWIDMVEVSNADYQKFAEAGGYTTKQFWSDEGWAWKQTNGVTGPADYGAATVGQPRVGVSWYEADAYARWRGCHLPSEAEWEYAARGPQSLIYPWGNTWNDSNANVGRNGLTRVTSYGNGKSWVGAYNMVGNAWEWVSDWYSETFYQRSGFYDPSGPAIGQFRVLRGGSYASNQKQARAAYRYSAPADYRNWFTGFRVVCSASPLN